MASAWRGPTLAAESLIRHFGDVRSAHHYPQAGGAKGVRHAVSVGDHAGHGADADQVDFRAKGELHWFLVVHGLSIAVDQHTGNYLAKRELTVSRFYAIIDLRYQHRRSIL
jgi:hypothetical protein